jgi:hypothetical protein
MMIGSMTLLSIQFSLQYSFSILTTCSSAFVHTSFVRTRSEGLIDRCDLVFLAKSKEMNSFVFLEWFKNQLMPALKNPSLVVLDNASYHNVKTDDKVCPNFSQRKAILQNYLTQHNIPFSANDTKKKYYMKK